MIDSKENNKFDLGVWGLISTGTQYHSKLTLCTEFIYDNGKLRAKISLNLISSLILICFLEIWYSMWKKKQQQRKKNALISLERFFAMFILISLLMKTSLKRLPQHFDHKEWVASNFSIQYPPWITHYGHENKGNDHQLKEFLIVKQILPVSTSGNVYRTVRRKCIQKIGCKGPADKRQKHTLGVCPFTLPARAREPWTLPVWEQWIVMNFL